MNKKIQKVGNSLGIVLTKDVLTELNWSLGKDVKLTIKKDIWSGKTKLIIEG